MKEMGSSLGDQVLSLGLWDLGDLWSEAHVDEVVRYLRGSRHLQLPAWARPLLPTEIRRVAGNRALWSFGGLNENQRISNSRIPNSRTYSLA